MAIQSIRGLHAVPTKQWQWLVIMKKQSFTFCVICGGKNKAHKRGCKQYKAFLLKTFGSIDAIFQASDNGLLPKPPWDDKP
jgi:hypothetical protein